MKIHFAIIFCLLFWLNSKKTTAENYFFDQISLNQGLSQSTVKSIFRDHIGLLWIGTRQGLNRYDGSKIKSYYADGLNENTLPNDNIFFITEDAAKNLWIGTGGTLCRYDRKNDLFVKEKINGREISLRNILVRGDYLYSVTSNSILTYNSKENSWTECPFKGDETNLPLASKLENSTKGKLLIGSRWKGLYECDPRTGELKKASYFEAQSLLDIYRDSKNRLWVSEYGKGVLCFDTSGKLLDDLSGAASAYKNVQVMDILEYQNKIWMVTDGNGVLIYSPETKKFEKIGHEQDNPFSIPVNSFMTIYTDHYNNLWLGTIRGGLIGVRYVNIQTYGAAPLNSTSGLSEQTVLSFYEDADKIIWIGTDGEGLNRYNPEKRKFTHYPSTYGKKVSSITNYSDKFLLLSLYKEGLMLFNKQNGLLTPFQLKDEFNKALQISDWIGFSVLNNNKGEILISNENVYSYSIANRDVLKMKTLKGSEGAVKMYIPHSLPDRLIFYSNTTVCLLNLKTNITESAITVNQEKIGVINAVDVDTTGVFWLGMSTGLYSIHTRTKKLKQIKSNLIKSVSTLVMGNHESMWIGSGLDLLRFNIKTHDLIRYQKADGISPNEYLNKSRLCTRSGDVYLGGVSGFCRIEANIPIKKKGNPAFELLDIQLNGLLVPSTKISTSDKISTVQVPWDYTSLTINLFMNTPELNNAKRTRYNIVGFSDSYNELEKMSVSLPTLAPGNYSILVQSELSNEKWSQAVNLINIEVLPPWWRTWWFYTGFLAVIVFSLFRFRQNEIKKASQRMELEMQQRDKNAYEQKVKFLINISHELRTPLTLIYSPLRRLLKDEKTPKFMHPMLSLMYKHVRNMKNMIDMVLDVRKMEMSHEILRIGEFNINDWIRTISEDFRQELDAKNIQLKLELDEQVGVLSFDKEKCDKVLSNLIMNAIKFSNNNTTIIIFAEKRENSIYISVSDEGIGVDPQDVNRLFTQFYQGNHQISGTGIGLSFARSQIELHGGKIGYQPRAEKGSIFWFELPISLSKNILKEFNSTTVPTKAIVHLAVNPLQYEELLKLTILIVEDEPDLLDYLKDSFSGTFNKVLTATNGEKALHIISEQTPDLVVSDVMMPVMDGFEMCRQIKTNIEISHIPVILLTALGDEDNSLTGYKMGADIYLSKPFGVDLLLAVISNLIKSHNDIRLKYGNPELNIGLSEITFSNADEKFINKLIQLIEDKLTDSDILIDNLATEMAMSRTSFYNKVKAVTGMSANVFIVDFKIKKASHMLQYQDLSINEIAMDLGFVSQRYFSTVFKQITKKTPTQYRTETRDSSRKHS